MIYANPGSEGSVVTFKNNMTTLSAASGSTSER